jgi:serine/threonine protein kinase
VFKVFGCFRAADQDKVPKGHFFGSIDRPEQYIFEILPPNNNVVRWLGYFLDAPQPDGSEENLALILEFFNGGSLETFMHTTGLCCSVTARF